MKTTFSERWFRFLTRFYPADFRDGMGDAIVETYMDRARGLGAIGLLALWLRALLDSLRSGVAENIRPAVRWRRTGDWGRDLELVTRRLWRSPMFATSTIATLAIGLAMFAVAYTIVQRVLIDPMPFQDSGDLHYIWRDYGPITEVKRGALAGTDIVELQKPNAVIVGAAGMRPMLGGIFSRRPGSEVMELNVTHVSRNLFELLGVKLALGRSFLPEEEGLGSGSEQAIVLTHHLWNRLGADAGIVGTEVSLQGRPHTVVGVLPAGFAFARNDAAAAPQKVDAYIPFAEALVNTNPLRGGYAALIRVRRGADPAAAVAAVGRVIDARDFSGRGLRLYAVGMKDDVISRIRAALVSIGAAGLVLLFMLAVNLASALMARVSQREMEVAVSRALGANTAAILRSTVLEGAVLGLTAGALGALAAYWGCSALLALAPADLPRREAIAMNWQAALIVVFVGMLVGCVAAVAPAVWAARESLSSLVAGAGVRGGGAPARWRRGMIVMQVALSLVLLSCGALVVRSFERMLLVDPGFQPDGVFTVKVRAPPEFFPSETSMSVFQDRVLEALAAIPGVSGSGAASVLPLTGLTSQMVVTAPGAPGNTGAAERDQLLADLIAVRGDYFKVMGIGLLAGQMFAKGELEAIVDSATARKFFPDGGAVGARITLVDRTFTIIGVVNHARQYSLHADGRPQVLVRADDFTWRPLFYAVRTERDPESLLPEVGAAVRRADPRVPAGEPRSMAGIVRTVRSPQSVGAALVCVFALGALLLTAMGLFGVVAGSVNRRRHELAIRMAVGADHQRILRLVMLEGAVLVALGLLAGAPGIYLGYRVIQGLLVGVSPSDWLALVAAGLGLAGVAMLACYLPARRVLGFDPARLLQ